LYAAACGRKRRAVLRPAILVLILSLEAVALPGAERNPPLTKATVTIVPNIGSLSVICNSKEYIFGCTAFDEALSCSCLPILDQWRLDTSARVTPSIYLWKLGYLGHEKEHIGDIRGAVLRYLDDLDGRRYASAEECRSVARTETIGFHDLINSFADDSNAKRHPSYRRRLH
jgi:hypothetical protein